jgi:hypothetical protein
MTAAQMDSEATDLPNAAETLKGPFDESRSPEPFRGIGQMLTNRVATPRVRTEIRFRLFRLVAEKQQAKM